jgi:phospholipase B1
VSFTNNVRETLDFLHANFPRTFVNLVLILDFRHVEELNAGGLFCSLMHRNTCPCCAYPSDADREALAKYIPEYKGRLIDLINSGRYDTKDDFTVVIQPFMADTPLPRTPSGDPDYSYFAPDCFHFSG